MKASQLTYRKVSELHPFEHNPRKIEKEDFERLVDSIRTSGWWEHRPAALEEVDGRLVVLCGNQRLRAAKKLRLQQVPTILYSELTDEERKDIIARDNVNNGEFDYEILDEDPYWEDVDLEAIGVEAPPVEEPEKPQKKSKKASEPTDDEEDGDDIIDDGKDAFYRSMLGDFIYDSDNRFEIPNLLLDQQPKHLELPLNPWGANSRLRKGVSTYHFYVDDYRFEALFKDPINLLSSGCKQIVEPNCSCHDQTPIAMGIYQIFRKRYLARYFQECGVKVWVDLNVSHRFIEYNKMGVPKGYNAFCTRGLDGWMESLKLDLQVAQEISGLEKPNLLVYGGGEEIQEFCREHGLVYITDFINAKKK